MALDLTGIYVLIKGGVHTVSLDGVAHEGECVVDALTYCQVIGGEVAGTVYQVAMQLAATALTFVL